MIDNKTGGFFRLITRLMVVEASLPISDNNNLVDFMTLLGRYYQIRDDYQNLVSDEVSPQSNAPSLLDTLLHLSNPEMQTLNPHKHLLTQA